MKLALVGILILLGLVSSGQACTFQWDKVTTYTDGSTIPSATVVTYKLYFKPQGASQYQSVGETVQQSITVLCPAGSYYVTAYTATDAESGQSNVVAIKQVSPPVNLRWGQ